MTENHMPAEAQCIKVHCPNCSNKRLFDLYGKAEGILKIKCPVCRKEVEIQLGGCDEQRQSRLTAYFRRQNIQRLSE